MTSGQISQCHLIQVENDSNHWTRISRLLPPLISAQLKATLTLLLFFPTHCRGFTVAYVQYLTSFHPILSTFLLFFYIHFDFLLCLLISVIYSFPPLFLSPCFSCCPYVSLPSHVKVLVYWTGLKLSVSWSVTLCWICSARLSSHWLAILNGPTHVWREPKLIPLLIWWQAAANTTLPDLPATLSSLSFPVHTHTQRLPVLLSQVIWYQSWRQMQGFWD